MKLTLNHFFKYTDKELKKILGYSKEMSKNSYIVSKEQGYHSNHSIYKLLNRTKNEGFVQSRAPHIYLHDFERLNYDKFLELKKIYFLKKYAPKDLRSLAMMLKKTFNKYYADEYFDVNYYSDKVNLILYYPEITISNSLKSTHLMRDVYVKYTFSLSHKNIVLYNLGLFRGTITMGEYKADYMFSHISNGSSNGHFCSDFCFGETDLNKTIKKYRSNILYTDILPLTIMLREYLSWESLEGVPYKYINKITDFDIDYSRKEVEKEILLNIYDYIINKLDNFKYRVTISHGKEKVDFPEDTVNKIEKLIVDYLKVNNPDLLVKQLGDKKGRIKLFAKEEIERTNKDMLSYGAGLTFKGNKIHTKIKEYNIDVEEIKKKYPDTIDEITQKWIVDKLKEDFLEFLILQKNNLL